MTGAKYLGIDGSGNLVETASNQTSAGGTDAGKIVALNSSGQIDSTMLPSSGAITMTASETVAAGAMINIWNNGGTINVRNADAATAKPAHGFVNSQILNGASGTVVIGNGPNTGVTSLTVGTQYFLGNSGAVTSTAPTASGSVCQKVGVAQTATELQVILYDPITRA